MAFFSQTLEYPMEAINLTKVQWDAIINIYIGALLKKAGIVASFPRDFVFSSTRYNGLGLLHPFFLQHIKHIMMLMGVDTLDNQSKTIIRTSWEEAISDSRNLTRQSLSSLMDG